MDFAALEGKRVLFRTDSVTVELEGHSVITFTEQIMPLLDGNRTVEEVAALAGDLDVEDLAGHLGNLAETGILTTSHVHARRTPAETLGELLRPAGFDTETVAERLTLQRVAIFGLESSGAELANQLAAAGIGEITLIDPGPLRTDDPATYAPATFASRQEAVAARLNGMDYSGRIIASNAIELTREKVEAIVAEVDIVVAAFDRDFTAVAHWINKAAYEAGKVSAFVSVTGARAVVGPIVLRRETPCFMCYRMRDIATRDDYLAEMALEECRDRRRVFSNEREPTMPMLAPVAGGLLAAEIVKTVLAAGRLALAGRIIMIDGFDARFEEHTILAQPNCSVCSKKNL